MRVPILTLAATALAVGMLGAACGGSSAPAADDTGAAEGAAGATAQEAGAAAPAAAPRPRARRIDPRRGGLEIVMGEWAVTAEASVIRPGPVTFVVTNRGKIGHGFEIEADEDSSGPGGDDDRHKSESRLLAPGESARLRLDLPPGVYKIECFVDGHDDLGMETLLEVRPGAPLVTKKAGSGGRNAVAIANFAFRPAEIAVQAGQAVTWRNEDTADHTVTHEGGAFGSETLGRGGRFRTVFERPGRYRYVCALHPEMKGTVVVER